MSNTQSPTAKLSDTQLVILSAAAQRADRSLLPFPKGLTAKGAALSKVITTLCKRKLAEERRIIAGGPAWRRDEDSHPLGLFITNDGLLALGIEHEEKEQSSRRRQACPANASPASLHANKLIKMAGFPHSWARQRHRLAF